LSAVAKAGFRYSDLLPTGADDTPYRLITTEGASDVEGSDGQQFLKVAPED
jgi:fumarate hydratase class I